MYEERKKQFKNVKVLNDKFICRETDGAVYF